MKIFKSYRDFLYHYFPKRSIELMPLTRDNLKNCPCGTKDLEDVWIGSTWYNDSSYSNSDPEMFFVKCDECGRISENASSHDRAVWYWNINRLRDE